MIPYGKQSISREDIETVITALESDFLTTGPAVERFENAVSEYTKSRYAISFSSGTAALHGMMKAVEIGPGDEVITSPITFAATSNAVLYVGATPVFADVAENTLLIDPSSVESKITPKTRAMIAVDYAGQPCRYSQLEQIASKYDILLLSDGCHALGAEYHSRKVGSIAQMTAFSFHPVKHITTGEGGMVTTDDKSYADKLKSFRNHGINSDFRTREKRGTWFYEMMDLGFNYRLSDIQSALGESQIKKLPGWLKRRNEIADVYTRELARFEGLEPLFCDDDVIHAYHLYVVKIKSNHQVNRKFVFERLRKAGILANVHYIPVYRHPYYQKLGYPKNICPNAEKAYEQILSLPIFPGLKNTQLQCVIDVLKDIFIGKK